MRTVLYANPDVSKYLRENFVLAWTSERPVPRITIDFGDGRVLESTVAGNAAHYVLDAQGRPLDVLPGLYEPRTFKRNLERALWLHTSVKGKVDAARDAELGSYHVERMEGAELNLRRPGPGQSQFMSDQSSPDWEQLALFNLNLTALDRRSVVLMARELPAEERRALTPERITEIHAQTRPYPSARRAADTTMSKMMIEAPVVTQVEQSDSGLQGMLSRFMEALTVDTVRNEMEFRPAISRWFAAGEVTDFATLNERVYREIFLTPGDDPWLGLKREGTYSGTRQTQGQLQR